MVLEQQHSEVKVLATGRTVRVGSRHGPTEVVFRSREGCGGVEGGRTSTSL